MMFWPSGRMMCVSDVATYLLQREGSARGASHAGRGQTDVVDRCKGHASAHECSVMLLQPTSSIAWILSTHPNFVPPPRPFPATGPLPALAGGCRAQKGEQSYCPGNGKGRPLRARTDSRHIWRQKPQGNQKKQRAGVFSISHKNRPPLLHM